MSECAPNSCGCSETAATESDAVPIVCTLAGHEHATRAAEFRAVFTYLESTETFPGGFRWRFKEAGPDLEERLRDLALREHACCRFFDFRIDREGDHLVWQATTSADAQPVLDELMRFPETLAEQSDPGALQRALGGKTGLVFASEYPPR